MQISPNINISHCTFINLTYLSESVATLGDKMKNIFFLYKYFGLDPKIEMANISASMCLLCMIVGSQDLSKLVFSKSGEKMVTSITNQIFHFSRSCKGQFKVKEKCCFNKASNCTCFICTWLWDLSQVISDLF